MPATALGEEERDSHRGCDFSFAVAEWVALGRLAARDHEPAPDDEGGEDVAGGFDFVSDYRVRVPHEAGYELDHPEDGVHQQPEESRKRTMPVPQ